MRFVSTRHESEPHAVGAAMWRGLAPDGGLFVPERFPRFDDLSGIDPAAPLGELAATILEPFFEGDPLLPELRAICDEAFNFPMPLVDLPHETTLLELFHGPTAAFKDFGARFLAACLARMPEATGGSDPALTVLVATSGDTGAAVAAAFYHRPAVRVGVLFPDGGVSPRQEHQLTCWGENVTSMAVRGNFDACQVLVKQAFSVAGFPPVGRLSSANSINVGRLLPQALYYAVASLRYRQRHGHEPGVVVPSGNVGNAVGAMWAREMGFPIREIAMASNANRVVPDWFRTGEWRPRSSLRTLANAMDVGDPSNMERVFHLFPDRRRLRATIRSMSVDDETIRSTIRDAVERWGQVVCPHTATALRFREKLDGGHWIVVATAHPAKFDSIVEPLIGHPVELPDSLAALLERPTASRTIEPTFDAMVGALAGGPPAA